MVTAAITGGGRNCRISRTDRRRRFSELSQSIRSTGRGPVDFFVVAVNTLATRFD